MSGKRSLHSKETLTQLLGHREFALAFQNTVGVGSWLALAMIDINKLEMQKEQQLANGNLSIRQLVSQADIIEERLESGIKRISGSVGGTPLLEGEKRDNKNEGHHLDLQQTFILSQAALVHLNVVVSGASSGIPEIQQSIKRAITAWNSFSAKRSMNSKTIAWSICASASLASGDDRVYFQELIQKLAIVLRIGEINLLMERCWETLDRAGTNSCDWREFLRRYDQPFI